MKDLTKPKPSKHYVVSVFDDRHFAGALAFRNIKIKSSAPGLSYTTLMVLIILSALKQAYPKLKVQQRHCTKVRVYVAGEDGHVLDGNNYTEVSMKEESEILTAILERQHENEVSIRLLKAVAHAKA